MEIYDNPHSEVFVEDRKRVNKFDFEEIFCRIGVVAFVVIFWTICISLVLNGCERQKMINKNLADLEKRLDAEQPTKTIRF